MTLHGTATKAVRRTTPATQLFPSALDKVYLVLQWSYLNNASLLFPLTILGLAPTTQHLIFLERQKLFLEAHSEACLVTMAQYPPESSPPSGATILGGWQQITPRSVPGALVLGAEPPGSSGRGSQATACDATTGIRGGAPGLLLRTDLDEVLILE